MLTPKEMFNRGVFGGTYFSRLVDPKKFPDDWFEGLDEIFIYQTITYPRLIILRSNRVNLKKNGRLKGGYIKMIPEVGSSGIVNILQEEDTKTMKGKSRDGWLFVAPEDVGETSST